MMVLAMIFFFHAALAEIRPLSEDEATAFQAIFGTSDMQKLLEIEKDPAAYWDEREKALKDEAIPHIEFCKTYTQEAEDFIRETSDKTEYKPWFCVWPEGIAQHTKTRFAEDDPAYPTALALFTSIACDHMNDPKQEGPSIMKCPMEFCEGLDAFKENEGLSHELNERQRWVIRENAEFSIFDSLVMLHNKEYLCAAAPCDHRRWYQSHKKDDGTYQFVGVRGPISHDSVAHARRQYILEYWLRRNGISSNEYFKKCWNKENLVKNDIFALAEQNLGCYYNFHELPTGKEAWSPCDLHSLIFPETHYLTDSGFLKIVPCFAAPRSKDFDWRKTPVKFCYSDDVQTHWTLLYFRRKYCGAQGESMLERTYAPGQCTLL